MGFDEGSELKKDLRPSVYVSRPSGVFVAVPILLLYWTAYLSLNFYWEFLNISGEVTQWHATAIGKNEGNRLVFVLQSCLHSYILHSLFCFLSYSFKMIR